MKFYNFFCSSMFTYMYGTDMPEVNQKPKNIIMWALTYNCNARCEYCYLNDIKVEAWSSLMASWSEGTFIDNPNYPKLNNKLEELANKDVNMINEDIYNLKSTGVAGVIVGKALYTGKVDLAEVLKNVD